MSAPDTVDSEDVPCEQGEVAGSVEQLVVLYEANNFLQALIDVLQKELDGTREKECRRVLVLFPTVRWLQFFCILLKHRVGIKNLWAFHRSVPDEKRRARVALFSQGGDPTLHGALFATDAASRGLDFDVHSVVQIGPPSDREMYVHRTGRT